MLILRNPVIVLGLLVGVCIDVVFWQADAPFPVGLVVVVEIVVIVSWLLLERRAAGLLRRGLGARPALAGEFPRLHNTVEGLCLTHGINRPQLFVVDSLSGNALAMSGREGTSLVLTTGAADHLGLVELEALVAHLLVRCGDPALRGETARAALGRLALMTQNKVDLGPDRLFRIDFEGADLTRFPPGMQKALRALTDLGTAVDAPAASSRLWLLQTDGQISVATADHPPVAMRIDALGEL